MTSDIRWIVPCPKPLIDHVKFYKVYESSVRLLIFLMYNISAAVTIVIYKSAINDDVRCTNISYTFYFTWAILTSVSVPDMPRTAVSRMLFLMWVCYSLILSTVFQSFFTSFLVEPGSEKQVSSMEELLSRNLTLLGDENMVFAWFSDLTNETFHELDDIFNISEKPIENVFSNTDSAVVSIDVEMRLKLKSYYSRGLRPCEFVQFGLVMYTTNLIPSSPYYEAINWIVLRCFEAGLFIQLVNSLSATNLKSVWNTTQLDGKLKLNVFEQNEYYVLNTKRLNVVFYILISGCVLSFIVFMGEMFSVTITNMFSCSKLLDLSGSLGLSTITKMCVCVWFH